MEFFQFCNLPGYSYPCFSLSLWKYSRKGKCNALLHLTKNIYFIGNFLDEGGPSGISGMAYMWLEWYRPKINSSIWIKDQTRKNCTHYTVSLLYGVFPRHSCWLCLYLLFITDTNYTYSEAGSVMLKLP